MNIVAGFRRTLIRKTINWSTAAANATRAVALSLPLLMPTGVSAQMGFRSFQDAAMAKFNEADWALLKSAAIEVLNAPSAKASKAWTNPDSGHHGVIRLVKAFESEDGRHCKRLRFDNFAERLTGTVRFNVCRATGGTWRLDS